MESFYDEFVRYDWDEINNSIYEKKASDVERALSSNRRGLEDFLSLISPAAESYLDQMANLANRTTIERFGKTIQLYIPLYVSNHCSNCCTYCGFSSDNAIHRKILSTEEAKAELEVVKDWGFKHILLVSGESRKRSSSQYYEDIIRAIRPDFSQIALEVQPLDTDEYARLKEAGLSFVCVYQETYNSDNYSLYHTKGEKSNFRYRLETPDRVCTAGVAKMGIGALLGLEDWRTDSFFTALHLRYLEKKYWRTKYSISLPRLRPHMGDFEPKCPITDKQLVQLICAYRLFDQEVEISISTRESSKFRDMAMHIGATSMSAGSSTQPGGYLVPDKELEQFEINDNRTPQEMLEAIHQQGYEAIWKDWDEWM